LQSAQQDGERNPEVIVSQAQKKEAIQRRLNLKTAEEGFARAIVSGTNCSPFEAEIIVEKALESFGIGQWSEDRVLLDGQVVFHAVSAESYPGCPLEQCPKVRVVLTLISRKDDLETQEKHSSASRRRQQISRMAVEAQEQGALLTQEDLALLTGRDVRTIRSDIRGLRERGVIVPTRGTVQDIGPGVTHKEKAVLLWLEGSEPLDVARRLNHSLRAVERYIQTYCRVVYAQRKIRDILKTALVVGISVPAANLYFDLHSELIEQEPFYRERIDEVLRLGESHWVATDGKKSPSPTPKRRKRGSQA
jgi:hypothetical protein